MHFLLGVLLLLGRVITKIVLFTLVMTVVFCGTILKAAWAAGKR